MNGRAQRLAVGGAVVLALALLLAWVSRHSEWVEVDVPRAPTGKAAEDAYFALERLLAGAGARVVRRDDLAELPAAGATLWLTDWSWGTLPERDEALHAWVQRGGHLAFGSGLLPQRTRDATRPRPAWLPVEPSGRWLLTEADARAARAGTGPNARAGPLMSGAFDEPPCYEASEAAGGAPAFRDGGPDAPPLRLCGFLLEPLESASPPDWSLRGKVWSSRAAARMAEERIETLALRVPAGAGSVTVVAHSRPFGNTDLLHGDNALLAVAALRAGPGATVWLVRGAGGGHFLAWLWSHAWAAVVPALLSLGLAIWRESTRFGPMLAAPALARRSMLEQIRGTAAFLWQRSPGALHRAGLRALDELAARRLRGYGRLDAAGRVARLAAATGQNPGDLQRAREFDASGAAASRQLPQHLAVLETARRKLMQAPAGAAAGSGSFHASHASHSPKDLR